MVYISTIKETSHKNVGYICVCEEDWGGGGGSGPGSEAGKSVPKHFLAISSVPHHQLALTLPKTKESQPCDSYEPQLMATSYFRRHSCFP